MTENNNSTEKKNDTLAFIIGGLFILGLVFATYNYFNGSGKSGSTGEENETISLEKLKETLSAKTDQDDDQNLDEVADNKEEEKEKEGAEEENNKTPVEEKNWSANQYQKGDIKAGEYEVKYGDTLWEIAEAVYGNGAMWTNILEANSSSIGFLPSGQQALIYAGQTITIPAL